MYSVIGCPVIIIVVGLLLFWSSLPKISAERNVPELPVIVISTDELQAPGTVSEPVSEKTSPVPAVETVYTVTDNPDIPDKKSLNASKQSSLENAIDELMVLTEEENSIIGN